MSERIKFANINNYIELLLREILEEISQVVKAEVSAFIETITYQMPTFKIDRVFFYFAVLKKHILVYQSVKGDKDLHKALAPYRGEKSNLKLPFNSPIPYSLIGRMAATPSQKYSKQ